MFLLQTVCAVDIVALLFGIEVVNVATTTALMIEFQAFYIEIGRRIREAREKRGFTQEALASLVSLTRTSVTNIEKGRQKFLVHTLVDIALVLKVSPESLLPESQSSKELDELLKDHSPQERDWIKAIVDTAVKE